METTSLYILHANMSLVYVMTCYAFEISPRGTLFYPPVTLHWRTQKHFSRWEINHHLSLSHNYVRALLGSISANNLCTDDQISGQCSNGEDSRVYLVLACCGLWKLMSGICSFIKVSKCYIILFEEHIFHHKQTMLSIKCPLIWALRTACLLAGSLPLPPLFFPWTSTSFRKFSTPCVRTHVVVNLLPTNPGVWPHYTDITMWRCFCLM